MIPAVQNCHFRLYPPIVPFLSTCFFFIFTSIDLLWGTRHDGFKIQQASSATSKRLVAVLLPIVLFVHLCWSLVDHRADSPSRLATLISLFAAVNVCWISAFYEKHSVKPPTMIVLFLLVAVLNDIFSLAVFLHGDSCETHGFEIFAAIEISVRSVFLWLECKSKEFIMEDEQEKPSPMETGNVLNTTFFWWVNRILLIGKKRNLVNDDIPPLETEMRSKVLRDNILHEWENRDLTKTDLVLARVVFKAIQPQFISVAIPRLAVALFRCSQPLLIFQVTKFVEEQEHHEKSLYQKLFVVLVAIFVYLGINITESIYEHRMNRLRIVIHGALVSLIYNKTLSVSSEGSDAGQALTLMSSDVENAAHTGQLFNDTWGYTLEAIIGLTILVVQVHWLFPVPVVMILLGSQVSKFSAKNLGKRQKACNDAKQTRMSALTSILSHMKSLKAMGLTGVMVNYVEATRKNELESIASLGRVKAIYNSSANAIGLFAPAITMVLYAVTTRMRGEPLEATVMFTTLATLAIVTHPANMVMTVVPHMISFSTNFERIQNYLLQAHIVNKPNPSSSRSLQTQNDIVIDGVNVTDGSRSLLKDITVELRRGTINICCGKIGSGKSVLSRLLLGELSPSSGVVARPTARIGYCAQTAWVPSGTIRDIICGFSTGGDLSYEEVVEACCLNADINGLPSRDLTTIGSRGVNLSGGQKQRVALARILYSGAKTVILDDTFAALDGTTEKTVVNNLFGPRGLLKRAGITVFWVTNSAQYFNLADKIILLDGGCVKAQGPLSKMSACVSEVKKFELSLDAPDGNQTVKKKTQAEIDAEQDVDRRTGDFSLYLYYIQSAGWKAVLIVAVCCFVTSSNVVAPLWTKLWKDAPESDFTFYLVGYLVLSFIAWLGTSCQMTTFLLLLGQRSSANLHHRLLYSILYAPLSFFTANEVGTTLNRFGQDIGFVDNRLPNSFARLLTQICKMSVQMIIIFVVQKALLLVVPFCAAIVYSIARLYLRTSRQLRVLELDSKAALFNTFAETVDGIASIRAFRWQAASERKLLRTMDLSMKPNYLLFCTQRWLSLVLELIVGTVAVIAVIRSVFFEVGGASSIGSVLNVVILANATLLSLVYAWTGFETSLGAVSRLREIEQNTPRESKTWETAIPEANWPSKGELQLRNVSSGYKQVSKHLCLYLILTSQSINDPILKNVNLRVPAGQKLIVCGRTGRQVHTHSLYIHS
ncbi:hypothetical protein VHEMI10305 [[Torrubiella] hemipterigena]|uniref:ABC transporter n=1 Tax=[Torrubiella] hemipterigena TaxID=1531966 RepID=A0A0A1TRN2_9HYPO|nr:hypothetical protein VHEMI10305 [[Torrubiella] hemipterigena]